MTTETNLILSSPTVAASSVTFAVSLPDSPAGVVREGTLLLDLYREGVIRTRYLPSEDLCEINGTLHIDPAFESSPTAECTHREEGTVSLIETASMQIAVDRQTGKICYADKAGAPLLALLDSGLRAGPADACEDLGLGVMRQSDETWYQGVLQFDNGPAYGAAPGVYGLGQPEFAHTMNYSSGVSGRLTQKNQTDFSPFLVTTNGIGILLNSSSDMSFSCDRQRLRFAIDRCARIDYIVIHEQSADGLIARYREITGEAPLFPKWAYGYWQSRNNYKTQDALLQIAREYRTRRIPLDLIVKDWFWWDGAIGTHRFKAEFPDPKGMIDAVHALNLKFMLSVYPMINCDTPNGREFADRDMLLSYHRFLDAHVVDLNYAEAREIFWTQLRDQLLLEYDIDAWWHDATEPSLVPHHDGPLDCRRLNVYAYLNAMTTYEGQRATPLRKRVCLLVRSTFAGLQRYAAVIWTGDIQTDMATLKGQISTGIHYSLSGLPYWTTDIGGYDGTPTAETYTRWFQFGTFCPIMRAHGVRAENEVWSWGPQIESVLRDYLDLRYRLMPYLYSVAWMVTDQGYTMMRHLVFDFGHDPKVWDIADQYLFGPAIMACPVSDEGVGCRSVYLPHGREWFDFWTGERHAGGTTILAEAPLERIPLFVPAGSILPLGPYLQHANEHPADPLELRVYTGADSSFVLYEDEGDSYDYEDGTHATIVFAWDEQAQQLRIGSRAGSYPGMLAERRFRIVWVDIDHGVETAPTSEPDTVVLYDGGEILVARECN